MQYVLGCDWIVKFWDCTHCTVATPITYLEVEEAQKMVAKRKRKREGFPCTLVTEVFCGLWWNGMAGHGIPVCWVGAPLWEAAAAIAVRCWERECRSREPQVGCH